jgi:hypothetical protein
MKKLWEKIKAWLKKNWLFVLNPLIIAIAYSNVFEKGFTGIEVLLALGIMANVGYWGYKLFSGKKVCKCKCPKCKTEFPCNCEV